MSETGRTMKYLIAVPCMSMVHTDFMNSLLGLRRTGEPHIATSVNSLIYDSRNTFSARACEEYDRVLFLDSDMVIPNDAMQRLAEDMDEGRDFVSGIYFARKLPTAPIVYSKVEYGTAEDGTLKACAEHYRDYPRDSLFEVAGCGMGCTMISTDLLKKVWAKYGPPFDPLTQLGEDLSFCLRVTELGCKIWCDSRVKCGHVGNYTFNEATFLAQQAAQNGRTV